MHKRILFVVIGLFFLAFPVQAVDYPEAKSWVNDYADVLKSEEEQTLNGLLKDFETKTSNQIFVLTQARLPSGTSLEEYVNELFERWQPGQEGQDNGALLAIFTEDRQLRIEVGYGLEGNLTDAQSKLIIENDITPAFKQNDYYSGIQQGLQKMIGAIAPNYTLPSTLPQPKTYPKSDSSGPFSPVLIFFLIWGGLIVLRILRTIARARYGWSMSGRGSSRRSSWHRPQGISGILWWLLLTSGGSSRRGSSGGGGGGMSFGGFSGGGGGSSGGGGASGSW